METILEVKDLTKTFVTEGKADFTAIDHINFRLYPGEILGIVGESGSGKSTLLKAAMGLLGKSGMVTRGDIWFQEKDIPDLSRGEMQKICGEKIGMIFQDAGASLCPIRTIGEQIYESITCLLYTSPSPRDS